MSDPVYVDAPITLNNISVDAPITINEIIVNAPITLGKDGADFWTPADTISSLSDTDIVLIQQGGIHFKTTMADIAAYLGTVPPPETFYLLTENGDILTTEDGTQLRLE